jgi:hypothetical protein
MMTLRTVPISHWQLGSAGVQPKMQRRRLAEGATASPNIAPGSISVLQAGVDRIIATLNTEIQALIVELDLVSPVALRVDPASANEISYIGSISPGEIRSAISVSAQQLSDLASRALSGALAHYTTSGQVSQLQSLKSQADQVISAIQGLDTTSISPESMSKAQGYLSMHLKEPTAAISSAEKAVVSAEAGSVPVLEPSEKNVSLNIAIGVGLVTVAGLVLWTVLG